MAGKPLVIDDTTHAWEDKESICDSSCCAQPPVNKETYFSFWCTFEKILNVFQTPQRLLVKTNAPFYDPFY